MLTALLALLVGVAGVFGAAMSGGVHGAQPAEAASAKTVRLAYFSVPPTDGTSLSTLGSQIDHLHTSSTGFRDKLKGYGFSGTSLEYQLASEVEGPGPYANSSASCNANYDPLGNQVANNVGDFCKYVHPHEDWFLHNGAGKRLYATWGGRIYYHMNPASSGWSAFALSRMQNRGVKNGYAGIHLDNVELSMVKVTKQISDSDGVVKEYASDDTFRAAWAGYLQYLSNGLKPLGNQLWANLVCDRITGDYWTPYAQYLDGVMTEMFATGYSPLSTTQWNNQLKQAELLAKAGKGAVLISQGAKTDTTKETFALASYLLVTDSNKISFRYSQSQAYSQWWSYSNFNVQLGAAKGARYASGSVWKRDFACGSVTVDPAAHTGVITQSACDAAAPTTPTATPVTPTATPVTPTATPVTPTATPVTPTSTPTTPTATPTTPTATATPTAPTVALAGVTNGQTVSGSIAVQANATSAVGVSRVDFQLDGTTINTEKVAPYWLGGDNNGTPYGFDTKAWTNASHTLKAVVTDKNGKTASAQVTITVNNVVAPSVTLQNSGVTAAATQTLTGRIYIQAVVASTETVSNVTFYLDGKQVAVESIAPYWLGGDSNRAPYTPKGFDTKAWTNGQHTLTATVTDAKGRTGSASMTITVQN